MSFTEVLAGAFVMSFWTFIYKQKITSLSGYHADTPITIKAEASSKADSRPN